MPIIALENPETGTIENIIVADLTDEMPEGFTARLAGGASIGWQWDGAAYQEPPMPDPGPPPVPATVGMVNLRLVLLDAGVLAMIDGGVSGLPDTPENNRARERWQRGSQADRNDPALDALAGTFGLTSEQVDDFFRAAASLG